MDAYFFVRYLSMCLRIFFPMAIIVLPILIPLNYRGGKGNRTILVKGQNTTYNVTGLDTVAWSNVSPENTNRYWAHLVLAIGVIIWALYVFHQELLHYIQIRHRFLGSLGHRLKASSTTVLIQDIPKEMCSEEALEEMYGEFPGGIRRIWLNQDFTKLVQKDILRKKYESRLENAETDMLRNIVKRSQKGKKVMPPIENEQSPDTTVTSTEAKEGSEIAQATTPEACQKDLAYDIRTKAAWTQYLLPKHRPAMRTRLFGPKVDTIYYCRRELARLNQEIEQEAGNPSSYPLNHSAFIQFNTQLAANLACQSVANVSAEQMRRRIVEISPGDINWPSLNLNWRQRYYRFIIFLVLFAVLILAFGVISFFTGILSKASSLAGSRPWLKWIDDLPNWLLSFIQGTLPPIIQVIILSGPLPILLRALTNKTRGATTGQEGERSLQLWYFIFLLFELFLIPTISAGLTSIFYDIIHNPASIPNLLATDLPTAANYYFSFLILQSLSLSATSILQTIRLWKFYIAGHVNTPDEVFEKLSWTNLTRIGSNIPWYTTFAVIGIVYSVIAPLMLIFVLITFFLFWVVIKNNVLYCVRTGIVDGAGLFYPNAINQLFTGIYFLEICMSGLFFLVRDTKDKVVCDVQGIIMAIALVLTVIYQIWLVNHLSPLFKFAPVQIEMEARALLAEYEGKQSMESNAVVSETTVDDNNTVRNVTTKPNYLAPSPLPDTVAGAPNTLEDEEAQDSFNPLTPTTSHNGPAGILTTPVRRDSRLGRKSMTPVGSPMGATSTPARRRPSFMHRESNASLQEQQREDVTAAKEILNRINRPLNEQRLEELENHLEQAQRRVGTHLMPRRKDVEAQMLNDPISQIIMQHNDELENLDPEDRDLLLSIAFTHPVLRETKPSVWIPLDDLGISDDEVRRTREFSQHMVIDNRGAYFDKKLKVVVDKPPPDMSEFAFIIAEL